ncbi:MAG: DUF1643 domain-containing protein [Shimia sp.]
MGETTSTAVYSDCEAYRYMLERRWGEGRRVAYVMLNPSTASELRNDPTIERCERRARAGGFGAFRVVNLFAFRATRPSDLRNAAHPDGAENANTLSNAMEWADVTLAAWGVHGAHRDAGPRFARACGAAGHVLHCLGTTKAGHPRHPLYVPYAQDMQPWEAPYE